MTTVYTTLAELLRNGACHNRYVHLVTCLGGGWGDDTPIPLTEILRHNGLDDALLATRADLGAGAMQRRVAFAVRCATRAAYYTTDQRVHVGVAAVAAWLRGEATDDEAAATAAAITASAVAARSAAAAASAVAADAAATARYAAAARYAADDAAAERAAQVADFAEIYGSCFTRGFIEICSRTREPA